MSELAIGTVVGGVRIDAVTGRGGMGIVYRGNQLALNRTVALKVVRSDLAQSEEFRERFKRESEIAASLDHPHIVPVYSAGEDDHRLYVTMRFVDGTDLRELIIKRGRLAPQLAAEVVSQIGGALDAAHRRGLVHRDVKSANILLTMNEGRPHAYLTDFGLSRAAADGGGLTKTGTVLGTLDYMAPEQLEGAPVDGRVDVYALGCVFFQALTGQLPFPRDTEPAKMWAHMNQAPPSLATVAPDLPAGLDAVLHRAMAKRPDDRFATAGELGRAAVAAAARGSIAQPVSVENPAAPRTEPVSGPAAAATLVGHPLDQSRPTTRFTYGSSSPSGGHPPAGPPSYPGGLSGGGAYNGSGGYPPSGPAYHPGPPFVPGDAPSGPSARPRRSRLPLLLGIGAAVVAIGAAIAIVLLLQSNGGGGGGGDGGGGGGSTAAGTIIEPPIAVGKEPYDIESGEGFIWTTNVSDGTISKIDPKTSKSQQIDVGGTPTELVVDQGAVWVWNYSDAITRVDVTTGAVSAPIGTNGPVINGIAGGGGYVWLSDTEHNSVSRINMQTMAIEGTPTVVGAKPVSLTFGDRRLYVINTSDRTLTILDGTSGQVLGTPLPLDDELGGVDVLDGVIYVGTTDDVTRIDERSFVVGDPIPLKGGSLFAPDENAIWVAFPLQNELRRLDLKGGDTRGGPIAGVGKGVGDMVVVDGELWVTNSAANTVIRIRINS